MRIVVFEEKEDDMPSEGPAATLQRATRNTSSTFQALQVVAVEGFIICVKKGEDAARHGPSPLARPLRWIHIHPSGEDGEERKFYTRSQARMR